ncbi:MAG: universal stress protein [Desulfohalobiaceae bacterium]|nr:universal stress protein [Desulfohalobiaceae bacterium]
MKKNRQDKTSSRATASKLQPVRKILACLDLTDIDTSLIRYAGLLANTWQVGKIVFFHVIQAYDLPDKSDKKFPDPETELKRIISEQMQETVDRYFENGCHWEVVIRVGYEDAAGEVISYIKENAIDLALLGQKYGENREARYSRRIGAESETDILFVSQEAEKSRGPVLCALDFSEASGKAFERGLDVSRSWRTRLICYGISDPSRSYFPATTSRSSSRYQEQSRRACKDFLKQYDLSLDQVPCLIEEDGRISNEAKNIYEAAVREKAGLIVVGAQGDTTNVTSLLGNLCETFRLMEKEIPVLIVKQASRKKFPWFWKSS